MKRKFFVSSTFKDFQSERDMLMYEVIPKFRDKAHAHGDEVDSIDLRWGLDNFNLSEKDIVTKVLSVCFDEIDNSRPFMVIFLGDRFGWVPKLKWVAKSFMKKFKSKKFKSIKGKSVTALEIGYGLDKDTRAVICIRKEIRGEIPDNLREIYYEKHANVRVILDRLKKNLKKNYGSFVIEYTADFYPNAQLGELKNFNAGGVPLADAILEKLERDCEAEWEEFKNLPWQARELKAADNFAENRAYLFVGREELVVDLKDKFESVNAVFLKGTPGGGKTSIACKISEDFRKEGRHVCNIFCGTSPLTSSAPLILQIMIYFVEDMVENPPHLPVNASFDDMKIHLMKLVRQTDVPIYFIIDAVEMLNADEHRNKLDFLPVQSENTHCLVTCTEDFIIPNTFFDPAEFTKSIISQLSDKEIEEMILADLDNEDLMRNLSEYAERYIDSFYGSLISAEEQQALIHELIDDENLTQNMIDSFRRIPEKLMEIASVRFLCEELKPLESPEIALVLKAMLAKNGKELYAPTSAAVENRKFSCPLQLELVAQILNMIDSPELARLKTVSDIVSLTVKFVEGVPNELPVAAVHIFKEAMKRLGIPKQGTIVEVMELLAVSRYGLRWIDIKAIMENPPEFLDWSRLHKYLHNFFVERQNMQIDFAHNSIRAGIRDTIDAEKFKSLERRIAEYVTALPAGDSIREIDGFYYAQRLKNFKFAFKLLTEAHESKNGVLLNSIREALNSDGGDFCVELFHTESLDIDSDTVAATIQFFADDFQIMMYGGSKDELKISARIFKELASTLEGTGLPYFLFKRNQAIYENIIGNFDEAKEICEKIVKWGDENSDCNNLIFCATMAITYALLGKLALCAGDYENGKIYTERSIKFYEAVRNLDSDNSAMYDSLIGALRNLLQSYLSPEEKNPEDWKLYYIETKNNFNKDPNNPIFLRCMIHACTIGAYFYSQLERFDDALTITRECEPHARELQIRGAGGMGVELIVGRFVGEMAFAEIKTISVEEFDVDAFDTAINHTYEALQLLNQAYFQNPLPEIKKELEYMSVRLSRAWQELLSQLFE